MERGVYLCSVAPFFRRAYESPQIQCMHGVWLERPALVLSMHTTHALRDAWP